MSKGGYGSVHTAKVIGYADQTKLKKNDTIAVKLTRVANDIESQILNEY
jgi:hypothetical protein